MAKLKDKLTGEATDETSDTTPVVSTGTGAAEDTPTPPVKPKPVAKVKASYPVMNNYVVHCPNDLTLPSREVEAQTPADAKEKYLEMMGIITCGHPLTVSEV